MISVSDSNILINYFIFKVYSACVSACRNKIHWCIALKWKHRKTIWDITNNIVNLQLKVRLQLEDLESISKYFYFVKCNCVLYSFFRREQIWPTKNRKKWIFGQIWNYLIWPNMAGDSHRTHLQYLISRFSGQLIKIKIGFQPGVSSILF